MATGTKTGGRKAGTPNKPKLTLVADSPPPPPTGFPPYRLMAPGDLVAYPTNARVHSTAQIEKIAASLREFGFTNPVLTDGKRGIVAGHGRVLAAIMLGLAMVPTIALSHLTAAQRRAYVIADNRLALDADWDEEMLTAELGALRDDGFDLSMTGFDGFELDELLGDLPPETEPVVLVEKVRCPMCGAFRMPPAERSAEKHGE